MKNTLLSLKSTLLFLLMFLSFSTFGQCTIDALWVEITACEDELFDVSINFEHENTSDQFTVAGNGTNYGTFNYADLPITLTSLAADCDTEYEFVVTDSENNDCSDFVEWGVVCCDQDCEMWDLVLTTSECDGDVFELTMDFNYQGNTSPAFDWEVVGVAEGTAFFADLPLTVVIEGAVNDILGFVATENDNPNCAVESSFENPCIEPECAIGTVFVDLTDCVDGEFSAVINFEHENTSTQFTLAGNGVNYGTFSYNDLPITLDGLVGDCATEYEFVVTDVEENDCSNFAVIGTVCCEECDLFDLVIETSECDGTEFTITFDFEFSGTTNDFFDWEIPGVDGGFAAFSDLPLTVAIDNSTEEILTLIINENDNADCAIDGTFENPCFDPGDCFIGELNVEVSECDGNFFFVVINFEYENTSDQFTVAGNGNSYGTFSYADLPITIDGFESDCDLQYEFVVTDVNNNDCASDIGIGEVCCEGDCQILAIDFDLSPICEDGLIIADWLITAENTSEVGFDIFINDEFETFVEYVESGWYDFDINDPGTEIFTITACDNDNPDCCYSWELENPCFEGECSLFDLVIETSECDGGFFQVTFDFEYSGTTNGFFDWEIPGVDGGFAEFGDLPLTVLIENTSDQGFGLFINENDNPDCAVSGEFENPCYTENCFIGEINVEVSECDGNLFFVVIDFEYENTSDQFTVAGNGNSYGTFSYADLPIIIDGLESDCDLQYEFVVVDVINNDCLSDVGIGEVCCEGDCQITTIDFGENPVCVDGFIVTEWLITGENISEVGFDIFINDEFETFVEYNETDWYDFDIENPDTEYFTITACDNDNEDCCYSWELENPCYGDCELYDLVIETSECDGGSFAVTFDFEYTGTTNSNFNWEIPGITGGTEGFDNLPVTVVVENTSEDILTLFIGENDNPDCSITDEFENPCFEPEDCFIGELNVEVSECDGNLFFVVINFEYENTSDQFTVAGNGNSYGTFSYADLPITIDGLEADCDLEFEFVVQDVVFDDCGSDVGIGEVCCDGDCQITTLDFGENPTCVDGFIVTEWLIDGENISEVGFDIFINNEFETFVEYNETDWYDFDIADPGTEYFTITVCDNDNEECCYSWELENPCYEGGCELDDLVIETSECDDGVFEVTFDFEYSGTNSAQFDWEIPGVDGGTTDYADLPFSVLIENTSQGGFGLFINDSENADCAIVGEFENPCFDSEECFIGDLNVEVSECDGNLFFVVINFEYENTSEEFNVVGNGVNYGTYAYADLPITIDGIESNCDIQYEFVVEDVEMDCASAVGIGEVCCEEGECEIVSIDFGDNPICVEGFIVTDWLILGENISEVGFDIYINDEFLLFVEYNETNWYDFDIENPGTANFVITACDNDNEDCCYSWEVPNPCFDGEECDLYDLDFDASECEEGGFFVVIDFKHTGTTSEAFIWEIPGIGSGEALFDNLPITIEIENTSESQFTFFASDAQNAECDIVGTFGNPCYDSQECVIDGVTAEVVACEEELFDVEIDFEYNNVGSTFTIVGNGVEYGTFEYEDLPIILTSLEADCELEYEFVISDTENEECSDFVVIGTICCEDFNQINGAESETIIEEGKFEITFDIDNTTLKGCNIEVYIDGVLFETLSSDESEFTVGPFDCGQEGIVEINLVNTCSGKEWTMSFDLSEIDCTTDVEEALVGIELNWNMMSKTLSVEGEEDVNTNLQLINAQGALIIAEQNVRLGWSQDLSDLPSGLYFVRIMESGQVTQPKGLIKKILIH